MERAVGTDDIVLLLDHYSLDGQRMHESWKRSGCKCVTVVVGEETFLPEDVTSVYGYFLDDCEKREKGNGKPKYVDELKVPDHWRIRGDIGGGKIYDMHEEVGQILYGKPQQERLVERVDWYDRKGIVRLSEHYNRLGMVAAKTIYDGDGHRIHTSWISAKGKEVITENHITGNIIVLDDGIRKVLMQKTDLILYFLQKTGLMQKRIFFNSLAHPFFAVTSLSASCKGNVLFWQESERNDIPGNMKSIFDGQVKNVEWVVVQKRRAYDRLLALGARKEMIFKLGNIYSFAKENRHRSEVLICTDSERIESLAEIVESLPQMCFHILALTIMSSKLMEMSRYDNVSLYPMAQEGTVDELFQTCDYYFDINHGQEILSSVRCAFLHNHLIFAFEETIHDRDYVAEEHIFQAKDRKRMIATLREVMADGKLLDAHLKKQHEGALVETVESYRDFIHKI